jgi:hypothetical protein
MNEAPNAHTNILLLTATVTPPRGSPLLARTDPAVRRRDYEAALAFYLKLLGGCLDYIVFAENSNSDISSLRVLAERSGWGDRVEFIVFDGLDHPPACGRGYGEFKLVDYAMRHSRTIAEMQGAATVWKVTGRYIVRNLGLIIQRSPDSFDLYCNCRNRPLRWVDMYLQAWSEAGYRRVIRGRYPELNEDGAKVSAEVRFRDWVDAAPPAVTVARRFTVTPLVEGARGLDNQSYSWGNQLWKYYLRSALRSTVPWLWV